MKGGGRQGKEGHWNTECPN